MFYFDASALIKRYALESGTPLVNEAFARASPHPLSCSMLTVSEIVAVLVRKRNDGRLNPNLFKQALAQFQSEITDSTKFRITPLHDALIESALDLIIQHNLNASDAIILRSALNLRPVLQAPGQNLVFWASDKRLLRAAQAEGLIIFDPEVETIVHLHQLLELEA